MSGRIRRAATAAVLVLLSAPLPFARATALPSTSSTSPSTSSTQSSASPQPAARLPVYAYFYQWFEHRSWDRAKQDYPLVGKYSSDDPHVLRNQIAEARTVGIDGFLTSWKSTVALNRRLELLLRMAAETHFDIGVVYEALDFARKPLPVATVKHDLDLLVRRWGPMLHSTFGKPVIVWTGTNEYTHAQIAAVHASLAGRAYLLAASKNVADYTAIADVVDGEAYYWSSSNPRSPSTASKLDEMATAVHAHHGIWISPAAPGFDGTTLGHTRIIDRDGGSTFERSLSIAVDSAPDALGVISWNEWSENTYIEPGQRYGAQELKTLRDFLVSRDGTSDESGGSRSAPRSEWTGLRAAAILVLLTSIGLITLILVGRRPARTLGQRSVRPPQRDTRRHNDDRGPTP